MDDSSRKSRMVASSDRRRNSSSDQQDQWIGLERSGTSKSDWNCTFAVKWWSEANKGCGGAKQASLGHAFIGKSICKMLSISCCFHLPDYHDKVTDLINHMKLAIATPPKADDSWFVWLTSLWGGWGYWLIHTCLPVALGIILLIFVLPCCLQCFSSLIRKAVTRTVTSVNMQRRPDKEYEMPDVHSAPSFVPKPPMHDIIVDFTDSDIE